MISLGSVAWRSRELVTKQKSIIRLALTLFWGFKSAYSWYVRRESRSWAALWSEIEESVLSRSSVYILSVSSVVAEGYHCCNNKKATSKKSRNLDVPQQVRIRCGVN